MMMPQQSPWTFVQGPHDRFPRTQGIGDMQGVERILDQLNSQKTELDFQKDVATYERKKIGQAENQMKKLMEMLKGA